MILPRHGLKDWTTTYSVHGRNVVTLPGKRWAMHDVNAIFGKLLVEVNDEARNGIP
jgi:hypothetical protein